jgi:hypothetical protein
MTSYSRTAIDGTPQAAFGPNFKVERGIGIVGVVGASGCTTFVEENGVAVVATLW